MVVDLDEQRKCCNLVLEVPQINFEKLLHGHVLDDCQILSTNFDDYVILLWTLVGREVKIASHPLRTRPYLLKYLEVYDLNGISLRGKPTYFLVVGDYLPIQLCFEIGVGDDWVIVFGEDALESLGVEMFKGVVLNFLDVLL